MASRRASVAHLSELGLGRDMAKEGGAALCALNQRVEADLLSVEELASSKILCSRAAARETISGFNFDGPEDTRKWHC